MTVLAAMCEAGCTVGDGIAFLAVGGSIVGCAFAIAWRWR